MLRFITFLRAIVGAFLVWAALMITSAAIFHFTFIAKEATGQPAFFPALLSLVFLLPLVYSSARLSVLYFAPSHGEEKKTKQEQLALWLKSPRTLAVFALFAVLPYPFAAFSAFFPEATSGTVYLLGRLLLPFFFIACVLGLRSGIVYRIQHPSKNKEERRNPTLYFPLHVAKYAFFYALGGIVSGFLYGAVSSLPNLVIAIIFSTLGAVIIGFFLFLWGIRIFIAVRKRKYFFKEFSEVCAKKHLRMPRMEAPYRSLFRMRSGADFVLVVDGKKYTCKMLSTLRPYMLHRIYADGTCAKVHRIFLRFFGNARNMPTAYAAHREGIDLWETRSSFAFKGEGTKVIIFNPCPKIAEGVGETGGYLLDSGLFVGEYKFYTATGFCNALSRDCLDK